MPGDETVSPYQDNSVQGVKLWLRSELRLPTPCVLCQDSPLIRREWLCGRTVVLSRPALHEFGAWSGSQPQPQCRGTAVLGTDSRWRNESGPCYCLHEWGCLGQRGLYLTLERGRGLNFLSPFLKHKNRIGTKFKNWKQFLSLESFVWLCLIKFIIVFTFSYLIFYHTCGPMFLY